MEINRRLLRKPPASAFVSAALELAVGVLFLALTQFPFLGGGKPGPAGDGIDNDSCRHVSLCLRNTVSPRAEAALTSVRGSLTWSVQLCNRPVLHPVNRALTARCKRPPSSGAALRPASLTRPLSANVRRQSGSAIALRCWAYLLPALGFMGE